MSDEDFFSKTEKPSRAKGLPRGRRPKPEGERLETISFKASGAAITKIVANAKKHAKGNLSEWLRDAGVNYKP